MTVDKTHPGTTGAKPEAGPSGTASVATAKSHVRQILDALYDTVLVIDGSGRILEANGRAERLIGYGRGELVNQPVSRVIQDFTPAVLGNLRRSLSGGKFAVLEGYCRPRAKESFLAELTAGRLGENGTTRMLLTLRNIEPRRNTQEMLRAAHNALENAASGIVLTDTAGKIHRANRSFLRIWEFSSPKDVLGSGIREVLQISEDRPPMIQMPLNGEIWTGEVECGTRKGRVIHVQVSSAPNRDSQDRLVGMIFSVLDITARKKAELALRREADAQISRAREAHEFSGLLTALTVPDLVQLIASTRKTGILTILGEGGGVLATVSFENGETRKAKCGEWTGEAAFFEMLRVAGQEFRFEARAPDAQDPSIQRSTLGLLLEGARLVDEAGGKDRAESGESKSGDVQALKPPLAV